MWNLCPTSPPGEGVWEGVVVVRWQCLLHRPAPLQCQIYERRAPWLSPSVGGCRHNCAQSREILASLGIRHPQSGYTDPKSADTWHPSSFLPTLITILELNSNRNFNSNELTILVNELSFEMDNWNKTRIKPMKEIGLCSWKPGDNQYGFFNVSRVLKKRRVAGGLGSGRSVEIYYRVCLGTFFTIGYFQVYLGILGT